MLFLRNLLIIFKINAGTLVYFIDNSKIKVERLLKGESATMPAIELSLATYKIAVTAPIERPHKPINDTFSYFLM